MKRLLFAASLLAIATPAFAVDFTQQVKQFDGKDFTDQNGMPLPETLGAVAENSLLTTLREDQPDDKNKKFWLALKIHSEPKDPHLTIDEIALVKKSISATQPIAVMGQALRLIDPNYVPK